MLFIDEIHRMSAGDRGDPLSGDGGLRARHHDRPGAERAIGEGAGAALHADRRDDADRAADVAAARAVRHRPPARFLRRTTTSARSCAGRRGSSACRSTTTRRSRSRGDRAARRASPTGCCGACATTRRCAPTARSPRDVAQRALQLLEVDEHGFDEVDRRLLRTIIEKFGGGPVGVGSLAAAMSEERDAHRGHLRAVSDPDRVPRSHAARPRRDGRAPTSTSGCRRPRKGSSVVRRSVARGRVKIAGLVDLRAAAGADQRRSREAGRHHRRVDPAAHRHPRAAHRRARRRHVRPGEGGRASARCAQAGRHARPDSASSSSAPRRRTRSFRAPRACCSTRSARTTRGASISAPPAPASPTR